MSCVPKRRQSTWPQPLYASSSGIKKNQVEETRKKASEANGMVKGKAIAIAKDEDMDNSGIIMVEDAINGDDMLIEEGEMMQNEVRETVNQTSDLKAIGSESNRKEIGAAEDNWVVDLDNYLQADENEVYWILRCWLQMKHKKCLSMSMKELRLWILRLMEAQGSWQIPRN